VKGEARRSLEIVNRLGLHARAATLFVQTVTLFKAEVRVSKDDQTVDGKSIIGLMMLAAAEGSVIDIEATGPDAEAALDAVEALVGAKFNEPK
jgi:phosphocarrier protein HPr